MNHLERRVLPLLIALLPAARIAAQGAEIDALRADTNAQIVKLLTAFGKRAGTYKLPSHARVAWRQIVAHYDRDNDRARKELGFEQKDGEWRQTTPDTALPKDAADERKRTTIEKAWRTTCERVAKLHRELAKKLQDAGHDSLAQEQYRRVLAFEPQDRESHLAIGNESFNGFFGEAEDIAFAKRMQDLMTRAGELAEKEYEVTPLSADDMPDELKASGLAFGGARSKHFTHWAIDSQDDAIATLQWAERAYELLGELLGSKSRFRRPDALRWIAIVRTPEQRKAVFEAAPSTRGQYDLTQAMMFSGNTFETRGGRAGLYAHEQATDADHAVAHVTKVHFLGGRNAGLSEGMVHAMTFLLCGSTLTHYADLPKTVSGKFELLKPDPEAWRDRLDEEIRTGQDWPLVQIPRERLDNFRESVRVKSWSFMLFVLARFPDQWYRLLDRHSRADLMPEDVEETFHEVLDMSTHEVDELWRAWAQPGSKLGAASGW